MRMNIILETDRLVIREFTIEDGFLIYTLNQNSEVTRYTHDPVKDIEDARQILQQVILPQYDLYNHGRWAVHVKPALAFIGWCGLKFVSRSTSAGRQENEIDLGYRFSKESWGNGYASEAAYACIEYGFKKLHLQRIVGRALPENAASIRVLEKCGMSFLGEQVVDGYPARTYEIINSFIPANSLSQNNGF